MKAIITVALIEAMNPQAKDETKAKAREWLSKYGFGTKVEVSGPDGEPLFGNPYAGLTAEELRILAEAQRNDAPDNTPDPA